MDLKKLEYLEAVYRLQSFTKAAEELYISQPSMSSAIRKLEEELNIILIDREAKPLTFTPDGLRFMSHVYRILDAVNTAQSDMHAYSLEKKKKIRLLVHSTLTDRIVSLMISDFPNIHPEYLVNLSECSLPMMLDRLQNGTCDLAYTLLPEKLDRERFESKLITVCWLCALLPEQHPLLEKELLTFQDLKGEQLVTFPEGSQIHTALLQAFTSHHITPNFCNVQTVNVMVDLVRQGKGIAFFTQDPLSPLEDSVSKNVRMLEQPIIFAKGFIMKKGCSSRKSVSMLTNYVSCITGV